MPDLRRLIDAVYAGSTSRDSMLHGEGHWKCVAWTGSELADHVPRCDRAAVLLFALLHDTQRLNDGHDPRAASFARDLHARGLIAPPAETLELLCDACHDHTAGTTSDDPTVGTCWDADRLNLWRVGMRPDPRWLSTTPAKDPARIQRSRRCEGNHRTWEQLLEITPRPSAGAG